MTRMTTKGIDLATPLNATTAAAFAADGYTFVCRYLVPSGWKRLTAEEVDAISNAGLRIVSVFETVADRALGGYAAGLADGKAALDTAKAVGQPAGSTIYFAVDFAAAPDQMATVIEYIRGAAEATAGYDTGTYGSYDVIEAVKAAAVCERYWQTCAWSRGLQAAGLNVYQYDCGPTGAGRLINGVNVDLDEGYGDEGAWSTAVIHEEDSDNMAMKLEQWQWDMLYQVMGKAYNVDQLEWNWMQKIVEKTLTAAELAFLNTVLDGRIDRKIEV